MSPRVLLAALLVGAALSPLAHAATSESFGVSPPQLSFGDPPLLHGGVAEGALRLQNGLDRETRVTLTPQGDLASWLSFDSGDAFTMAAGETRSVLVRVVVPQDAANGEWTGLVRVRAEGVGSPSGSGAALHMEVLPLVRALVGGEQVLRFATEAVTIADRAVDAPLVLNVDAVNHGNVRGAPRYELVVVRDDGVEALRETLVGVAIEPASKSRLALATSQGLPKGLYTATLTLAPEQGGERAGPVLFEVRPGAATASPAPAASGLLAGLDVEPWGRVGQPVALRARFVNEGGVAIEGARLTAEVYRGTERVGVVQGDAMRVAPGAEAQLVGWYEPLRPGAHHVLAYVTYDGVRTAVQEGAFEAASAGDAATASGASGGAGGASAAGGDASAKTPAAGLALVALSLVAAAALLRRRRP